MENDMRWWREAKYGLFIHWGLYSLLAGEWQGKKTDDCGEWIMRHLNIPVEAYRELAARFNPVDFDAERIVSLAADAGMKYLVFTAKHHDGFAMYHSGVSAYNIVDATPFKRDPVRELAESCKRHGIRFCLYYSQAQDWDDPDGYGYGTPNAEKHFERYFEEKCKPQVRELLENYGDIGLIWFDTPAEMTRAQSTELFELVKGIQPGCLVSGRIGNGVGEYRSTSDNCIPAAPFPCDWEVPATLNRTWGYKKDDNQWKTPEQVLELLLRINSRGGNYLLNIGPDGLGHVPPRSEEILRAVGNYVRENGEAIYGARVTPQYPYDFRWCALTSKPHHLFVHVLDGRDTVYLPCLKSRVLTARLLSTGEPLDFAQHMGGERRIASVKAFLPACKAPGLGRVVDFALEDQQALFDRLDTL